MKFGKLAVASAALFAVVGAQAQVVGSLGSSGGSFLTLSSAGLNGGAVATLSGGVVGSSSTASETMPTGTVGSFLASEATQTAVLTFGSGTGYLSFLWGTPDVYNQLSITDTLGNSFSFTAASLGISPTNGTGAQYVQFTDTGALIKTVTFTNSPTVNSFETANYSVSSVPEPETYALMLGGLGLVGFMARRRRG